MAKLYSPVFLHLDVACEYSTDGGVTWTALAADTYKEFVDVDLQVDNGRVKVRGVDPLLTLDPVKMKINQSNYDAFHIKQANSLTSLAYSFMYCTIKEIKLENINACTNFIQAFTYANIKAFHSFTTTAVTDLYQMFRSSSINYVGDITSVNNIKVNYMFYEIIDNSYIGNLNFGSRKDRNVDFFLTSAEIKSLPYINDCGYGAGTNTARGAINTQYARYGLYQKMSFDNTVGYQDSSAYLNTDAVFTRLYTGKCKFAGISLRTAYSVDMNGSDTTNILSTTRKLFSSITKSATSVFGRIDNTLAAIESYSQNFKTNVTVTANYAFMEDPAWIPEILEVDEYSDSSPTLHGKDSWYSRNMYTGYIATGQMVEQDSVGGVEDNRPYSNYKVVASSNAWVSRNGNYAVQTGTDVIIYDSLDVVISTIAGITPTSAELSNDGLYFYAVTGTMYDTAGASGQTITQTITKYLISDGSTVSTKTIISTDAHIVGLYNAGTEYNFAFVFTEFSGATATLSRSDAYKNFDDVAVLKTTPMTHVVDYVFHSHGEDCEFNAIDRATTNLCCMFIR